MGILCPYYERCIAIVQYSWVMLSLCVDVRDGMKRGLWEEDAMKIAVSSVLINGMSKKKAAREFGVPRATLQRHIKNAEKGAGVKKQLGRKCILAEDQEEDLAARLVEMENRLYGLTIEDVRRLVYVFCQQNNISHPFSHEKQMAGRKWLAAYFKRHKELSVRLPEKTSISRALGFNWPKVNMYFDLLEKTLFDADGNSLIPLCNIYNVDETGFNICQKSRKIVAKKGKKSVGILTSAEKGKNVTMVVVFRHLVTMSHQCSYFLGCVCVQSFWIEVQLEQ